MSAPDGVRLEEFLQRYAAGELTRDELLAAAGEDVELEQGLMEIDALRQALDEARREEREVLAEAEGESFPAGEELTRSFFRREMHADARRRRRITGGALALAATVLVLCGLWMGGVFEGGGGGGEPPVLLDTVAITEMTPGESTDSWSEFTFRVNVEVGQEAYFVIRVFDPERPDDGPLTESGRLDAWSWRPPAEEVAKWPDVIRWEVRVHDPLRDEDLVRSQDSSLSP